MKITEKFKRLSKLQRILVLAVLAILSIGLGPWILGLFGLPIIGYAVSRHSWRSGNCSRDKTVFAAFAAIAAAAVTLYIILRQPQFTTDWEGANPLDDQIMLLMFAWVLTLATAWGLAGWAGYRIVANARERKNRGVAAPE